MLSLLGAWRRVPILIRAVLVGVLAAAAATFPWAWLASENLQHVRAVPWGAAVMAAYLWLYWRYLTGHGWPASTLATRRESARARPLSADVWGAAVLAGVLGLATSIVLIRLIGRLVSMPHEQVGDVAAIPAITLLATAVVGAVVAGVAEEVSFRGYMQRPIEQRYGPVTAILVVGLVFGFAHGTHVEWSLILMPYYLAVAATYGALAWLTDSILPSLVLHAGGDLLGAFQLLGAHRSVLGPETVVPPGVNARFFVNLGVLVVVGTAAVYAYRLLAATARDRRASHAPAPTLAR